MKNDWSDETRCLHFQKYGDCHCRECSEVLLRNELRNELKKQLKYSIELWFNSHDRLNKPFESEDFIKFIFEE